MKLKTQMNLENTGVTIFITTAIINLRLPRPPKIQLLYSLAFTKLLAFLEKVISIALLNRLNSNSNRVWV